MIKKIITYTMLLLFVASTTSLPVTITMCRMTGNVQGKACAMMNHFMTRNSETCSGRSTGNPGNMNLTSNSNCCTTKTIDNSIKDNYITHESKIKIRYAFNYIHINPNATLLHGHYNPSAALSNNLPPGIPLSNRLYLSNSILLI